MRVLMLVYNPFTRDARVTRESRTLADAGHEVTVVGVLDRATLPEEVRDGIRIIRIDRRPLHYRLLRLARKSRRQLRRGASIARRLVHGLGSGAVVNARTAVGSGSSAPDGLQRVLMRFHKPLMYADFYWRAYWRVRRTPYDVVHAHDLNTLPVAWALSRAGRAKLVYDSHELYPEVSTLSARERRVWRSIEARLIRRPDAVFTVCESISRELSTRYGIGAPTVLLNAPSEEAAGDWDRASSPLRAYAGLADTTDPILLYTGGFTPNRGLHTLIRAASRLDRGVVVLMGWGRLEAELAKLIHEQDVGSRVRMLPPVAHDELLAYTAGADIGLIPYEPVGLNNLYSTPNKLFDYVATGVPVAASRLPEIARLVERYDVGRLFGAGDPREIAEVLNALLGDEAALNRMRANTVHAHRELSWTRQAEKLLAVYGS